MGQNPLQCALMTLHCIKHIDVDIYRNKVYYMAFFVEFGAQRFYASFIKTEARFKLQNFL